MRRIALAVLGFCVLVLASPLTSNPAAAGEYYRGHAGYGGGDVRYSSSCCYRKVVKYVRKVSYVRVDDGNRDGYYAPRYRSSYYYGSPYRTAVYAEPYRSPAYDARPYRYDGGGYEGGASGDRVGYGVSYGDRYAGSCTVRRIRVADGYGGWVWARSRICY